jgi:hypothetical protein
MNADVMFSHVRPHRALLLALLLALAALLAPVAADNTPNTALVPAALADGPQHGGGG